MRRWIVVRDVISISKATFDQEIIALKYGIRTAQRISMKYKTNTIEPLFF